MVEGKVMNVSDEMSTEFDSYWDGFELSWGLNEVNGAFEGSLINKNVVK